MLSAAASNTLLKTLEEPPAHVVFVLATTDPQKVLPTIRSRTQHFEFTLLLARRARRPPRRHPRPRRRRRRRRDARSHRPPRRVARPATRSRCSTRRSRSAAAGSTTRRCTRRSAAFRSSSASPCSTPRPAKTSRACSSACTRCWSPGHDARRVADDLLRTLRDAFLCANAGGRVPYDGPADGSRAAHRARGAHRATSRSVRGIEVLGQAIVDIRGQADRRSAARARSRGRAPRAPRVAHARGDAARSHRTVGEAGRRRGRADRGAAPAPTVATPAPRRRAAEATRTDPTGPMLRRPVRTDRQGEAGGAAQSRGRARRVAAARARAASRRRRPRRSFPSSTT